MFVIGTAGHVDHGKSALVRALTGVDPDRLQEEKDRGMTIDLGFASLKLPGGTEVGIVDVPGHERYIKNMLAGVGGIDLALLVIAADEGVMPQTREHLAILDLLGIERGVVVLTKSDLVDEEWLRLVEADVLEVLEGTTLAGSPIVSCSAVSRAGLDELLRVLEERLAETEPRLDRGRPRLPIDRVFTISGFGTVVTGTLMEGALRVGEEVEVTPAVVGGHLTALPARIRGLQNHGRAVEEGQPGTRTAANLGGIKQEELSRGQILTRPGLLQPTIAVDVRLRVVDSLPRPLRHNLHVTFHCFTSETPARLRLLEEDEALPGDEAWAQLLLTHPVAVLQGDHFIIRDANNTLGGGVIVAIKARRHRRRASGVIAALERQLAGDPQEALLEAIERSEPVDAASFNVPGFSREERDAALAALIASGRLIAVGEAGDRHLLTGQGLERLAQRALDVVQAHEREHALRPGIGKEELRGRLGLAPRPFLAVIAALESRGNLEDKGSTISSPGWSPALTPAQAAEVESYLTALSQAPFNPPGDRHLPADVVAYLVDTGAVVDAGAGVVFLSGPYHQMVDNTVNYLQEKGTAKLAELRDALGTSRRNAQAFLEHLDSERITLRRGDDRVLRNPPGR
jgi:selenocysteine-specific elongation factor